MPYEYTLNAPSEVEAGERFNPSVEICCTSDAGCSDEQMSLYLDGNLISGQSMAYSGAFCIDQVVGGLTPEERDQQPWFEYGDDTIAIFEPGEYTLKVESTDGANITKTLTVTGYPDMVIDSCTAGQTVTVGEPASIEVSVSNVGQLTGKTAVTVSDSGGPIGSEQITLSPDESQTVTFEVAYESVGEYQIESYLSQPSSFRVSITDARVV